MGLKGNLSPWNLEVMEKIIRTESYTPEGEVELLKYIERQIQHVVEEEVTNTRAKFHKIPLDDGTDRYTLVASLGESEDPKCSILFHGHTDSVFGTDQEDASKKTLL